MKPSVLRRPAHSITRAILSTHHRNIGFGYLAISSVAVAIGNFAI